MSGYQHPLYTASLAEWGTPRGLPHCQGSILQRQIPGCSAEDAMGAYPLFACADWSQLPADLDDLSRDLVCLSLVTDPFGAFDPAALHDYFERVVPYKQHFVTDLSLPREAIVSKHHRKRVRQAFRELDVELCPEPLRFLDEWVGLYAGLVERRQLRGMRAFSRASFATQLAVPGVVMLRACHRGTTVGIDLWYEQGDVSYGHLAAYSAEGYRRLASYALLWSAIEYFSGRVGWIELGAGAGMGPSDSDDGLTTFKRGWATGTRPVYFCGRIFDRERYAAIVRHKHMPPTQYFPAYRQGEFA